MSRVNVIAECARLASGAGAGALASVARRRGSLPMSATAKLLVTATSARFGTVGGGCLEAEIIERAMDVIERRVPAVSSHSLNNELAGDYGLTCGGTAEIFIEPVFPDAVLAGAWDEAAAIVARGERGVMATALDWADGPRKLALALAADARGFAAVRTGTSAAAGVRAGTAAAEQGATRSPHPDLANAAIALDPRAEEPLWLGSTLVEPILGKPRLVVFGAGHVGARVAEVASLAGWQVTVVDDRADFADPARLPFAHKVAVCEFHDVAPAARFDADTYVVIATRGHQHDAVIAGQLAPLDLRYLGMLGSRRKAALTARQLTEWGVADDAIARIRGPVGVSIGADTPEEIAVSIVAEMIAVRRAGSTRRGGAAAAVAAAGES
ncbi:MAG: XdhC family protein [Gemmatimonadota bacterium]|nr:XdhC family protein [Gemmatimonadota bacterium]